jgi:hypothetical protein
MDRVRTPTPDAPLRAYSELVDVLCRDGNADAGADLEAMWNELTDARRISVLCVYEFDDLQDESESSHLGDVVRERPVMLTTDYLTGLASDGSGT